MERKRKTLQWPLNPKELKKYKVGRLFGLLATEMSAKVVNIYCIDEDFPGLGLLQKHSKPRPFAVHCATLDR